MLRQILYNNTALPVYRNALDAYAQRQRAVASNIANAETPGYTARKVNFEERLKQAMGRVNEPLQFTDQKHIPHKGDPASVRPLVVQDDAPSGTGSGVNNVDVEREMTCLATTQISYELVVDRVKGLFTKISELSKM